jgi:hypothetical protein
MMMMIMIMMIIIIIIIIITDILYENYVCSCGDLECQSLNIYCSQQCIKHVIYRSMEHIFRASHLETLTFYDIMTRISAKALELWSDTPMLQFMKLFVKLLFTSYRNVIIVINLIY